MSKSLPGFGMVSVIISLNKFLTLSALLSSMTPVMHRLFLFSCRLFLSPFFLFSLLSFCSSDRIVSNDLSSSSLIHSCAWSNLMLKLSTEFCSVTIFFQFQNLFGSFINFLNLFVELLILYLYCFPNFIALFIICVTL